MDASEREARRWFLRIARVLTGFVILVCGAGALLWVNARFHPWTDRGLAEVRAPHAVLHLVNESGARCELAWRLVGGPRPDTWLPLPPPPGTPAGVIEARGFRLLAPLPEGDATVELRVGLAGELRTFAVPSRPGAHVRLRIAADRTAFVATGTADWLGAPSWGPEQRADEAAR